MYIKIATLTIFKHCYVTDLQNSPCKTKTLYPLNNSSFSPGPSPGNHHSTSCLSECDNFRDLKMWLFSK